MRALLTATSATLLLASLAPGAAAQDPARRINVVGFEPATGVGIVSVDAGARLEAGVMRFGLGFDYAAEPLNAGGSDRDTYTAVDRMGVVNVSAAVGLWEAFELGVQLPVVVMADGMSGVGAATTLNGAAAGDLRVVPKLGFELGAGFGLSFMPVVTVPTGASDANAGERGATFAPTLAVGFRSERVELALNVGYLARPALPFGRLLVDDQVTFGLGGRVRIYRGLSMMAEVFGGAGVTDNPDDPDLGVDLAEVPVEALGAVSYDFGGGVTLTAGGGAGLTPGWGTPAWRAFGALGVEVDTKPPPDFDRDGVKDGRDLCRTVAEDRDGVDDEDGCPDPDDDGDGLCDAHPAVQVRLGEFSAMCTGRDQCSAEAEDHDGVQDGDGCPDPDSDGDGLDDAVDACPAEAEDRDGFEDEDGCPDTDNDRDGVADSVDACPSEPETMNGVDDEDGCPDKAEATLTGTHIELDDSIFFVLGRATIKTKSEPLLDKIAGLLAANPQVTKVRVAGHTDDQGPARFNLELSKRRAEAVVAGLVTRGVAPARLTAEGFGSTRPVCREANAQCWAKNRRTELELVEVDGHPVAQ